MFYIMQGSIKYKKEAFYELNVETRTGDKWLQTHVLKNGLNQMKIQRDVAVFETGEVIGFEEIARHTIGAKQERIPIDETTTNKSNLRDFTAVSDSMQTEILMFDFETT